MNYTRIKSLIEKVTEFVNVLPKDITEDDGFSFILIAHDKLHNTSGVYTFLNEEDERKDLVQCLDNALSGTALKGEQQMEWTILNSMAEYLMRLCAMFPELYENFQKGVEKYKDK